MADDAGFALALCASVNTATNGITFLNQSCVSASGQADPIATNNRDSVAITVQSADLRVTKVVNNATPNEGNTITYTVTLKNNGPNSATNVRLTDLLPAGLTYTSSTPSQGTYASGTGLWTVGTLANGATVTLGLNAKVNAGTNGTTILNQAFVAAADQADPVATNNRDSVAVTVQGADLSVTKVVDTTTPHQGDTLRYTVTLRN